MEKYFTHPLTKKMFENKSFYVDVAIQNYDIKRFAKEVTRKDWCALTLVQFLAFGVLGDDHEKKKVIHILCKYCPSWRGLFW